MKIYVIDFEQCISSFTEYHNSIEKINLEKESFKFEINGIKKEMESIINQSKSFLLDESTKKASYEKFQKLQENAIKLEQEFRERVVNMQNLEFQNNFNSLGELVDKWTVDRDIDLILNKNQVVWCNKYLDATEHFKDYMKSNGLFMESIESDDQNKDA